MENNYNNNFNSGSPYSYNQTNQQTGDGTNTSWSSQVNGNTSQGYSQGTQYGQGNAYYSQGTQYGQGNAYYSQGTQPYGQNQQKKKRKEKVKKEHGKGGFGVKLAKCAAIALVFGLISGSVFAGTNQLLGTKWSNSESAKTEASLNKSSSGDTVKAANTSSKAVTDLTDVSDIADNVMPSIVAITNMSEKQVSTWYGYTASQPQESCGSGIIVSQDDQYIYVATNNHVVSGAQSITVQFSDDSTVAAEVKGTDAGSDLAYASRCIENEILMFFRSAKKTAQDVSLNDPIDTDKDGNTLTLLDTIATDDHILEDIDLRMKVRQLYDAVKTRLSPREREIILLRYGLTGQRPLVQREVAKKLNISRSYVSRLEKKALQKLRKAFDE